MSIQKSQLIRCPICHSFLIEPYENLAFMAQYLKEQGSLDTGVIISPDNTNLKTQVKDALESQDIYVWHEDPIKTKNGYAGNEYKGFIYLNETHIKELQEARANQENSVGILENQLTDFSDIADFTFSYKKHIEELRESTEKILIASGKTVEIDGEDVADLSSYFNYDEDGNYIGTYKFGEKVEDKSEWRDVNRDIEELEGFPKLPREKTFIKNIHLEDLRHPLMIGWFDDFTDFKTDRDEDTFLFSFNATGSVGEEANPYYKDDSIPYYRSAQVDKTGFQGRGFFTDLKTQEMPFETSASAGGYMFNTVGVEIGKDDIYSYAPFKDWAGAGSFDEDDFIVIESDSNLLFTVNWYEKHLQLTALGNAEVNVSSSFGATFATKVDGSFETKIDWSANKFTNPAPHPDVPIREFYLQFEQLLVSPYVSEQSASSYYDLRSSGVRIYVTMYVWLDYPEQHIRYVEGGSRITMIMDLSNEYDEISYTAQGMKAPLTLTGGKITFPIDSILNDESSIYKGYDRIRFGDSVHLDITGYFSATALSWVEGQKESDANISFNCILNKIGVR